MSSVTILPYICGVKGYYWIPQTDDTLNGRIYYTASIKGDVLFDLSKKRITFEIDRYFPVGSIFHFTHNCFNYVIKKRLRKPGLWYEAEREDGCGITPDDVERFDSGRFIHRTGFVHGF